jgi:DNA-3-methyladenine glycosylase II
MDEVSKRALRKHPEFRPLIKKHGLPETRARSSAFHSLIRAIISQQISGAAATSILARFKGLYRGKLPSPQALAQTSVATLRGAGISPQKAGYLHDLAQKFSDGTVRERRLASMSSEEIVAALTLVKGVGVWTVQMYLLFTLRRPDILPTGDLGIQNGFVALYRLRAKPSPAQMERIAAPWRAHASLASWYLWRAADEAKTARARLR